MLVLKCAMTYDLFVNFLLRWCNIVGVFVVYITIRRYAVVAAACFSMIICHDERVIRVNNVARYMLFMMVVTKTYTGFFLYKKIFYKRVSLKSPKTSRKY